MEDRTLMRTGAVVAIVAAICCATPLLVLLLGTAGLAAWAAKADYVLLPVLVLSVALVSIAVFRRRSRKES